MIIFPFILQIKYIYHGHFIYLLIYIEYIYLVIVYLVIIYIEYIYLGSLAEYESALDRCESQQHRIEDRRVKVSLTMF